jgi:hypothetical protein
MGTDDPSKLKLAEKSENRASLLAGFCFLPAPFAPRAPRMPPCHFLKSVFIRNPWFYLLFLSMMIVWRGAFTL